VQKDLLVNASREKQACEIRTRGGATTQDPLYPEGHPKRIEQDSQCTSSDDIPSKNKKKKKHKTIAEPSEAGKNLIRPFCITILYHNLLLFIDIFHI
jgi:hypothetical protein